MFRVEFATSNAAFEEDAPGEIAEILVKIQDRVTEFGELSGHIRDSNGNTIGRYEYTPED